MIRNDAGATYAWSVIGHTANVTDNDNGEDDSDVTITTVAGTADEIVLPVSAGIPALFGSIFVSWGETFRAGLGDEGNIIVKFDANGMLTIELTYWGQTLLCPWDYMISGDKI